MTSDYEYPGSRVISGARVQAFQHPIVASPPLGFRGGIVLGDSASDQRLRHTRYWQPADRFDLNATYENEVPGDFIYFGPVYHHFGHMMSEMVHRVIPARFLFGDLPLLMIGTEYDSNFKSRVPRFLEELLTFFGSSVEEVTIVTQNSVVETLRICEQGSDIGGGPKPGYLSQLDGFTPARIDSLCPGEEKISKVFVSRRNMKHGGNILGLGYIEELLELEGFHIFTPEAFSLWRQMDVYRSADIVIFPEGSACHGVELLGRASIKNCLLLERRWDHREIFRLVLEPRAGRFSRFESAISLGTTTLDPVHLTPMGHWGLSVVDIDELVQFLRDQEIAKIPHYNKQTFHDYAVAELQEHFDHHVSNNSPMSDENTYQSMLKAVSSHLAGK